MTKIGTFIFLVIFITIYSKTTTSSSNTMMRTLRMSPTDELCDGTLDLKTYLFMNKMCEDCFRIFRDSDIYSACRYCVRLYGSLS